MFDLTFGKSNNCEGITRRDLIKIGGLGAFGLGLPGILKAQAAVAEKTGTSVEDVNVIIIYLDGGPSHIDMFDPKPEAPAEIRGEFGAVKTNVPDIIISDKLPKLAQVMDKYSIIKGTQPIAGHGLANEFMLTGYKPGPGNKYPSYGSVYGRVKGYRNDLPPYAVIGGPTRGVTAGYMGSQYNPFNVGGDPNAKNFSVKDVTPPKGVTLDRIDRRSKILRALDRFQKSHDRAPESIKTVDKFYAKAYDLVTSPAAKKAFAIDEEPDKLRDDYGRHSFGQGCLLARRMIEAGVRFITVRRTGWDTHQNNFTSLGNSRLPELDQGYSALLRDLDSRGMLANTVVSCFGEFGRTPKVNSSAGRDHWAGSTFMTIGGGPIKRGLVVGDSNERAEYPVDRVITIWDFAATMYRALGLENLTFYGTDTRPHKLWAGGTAVEELF